jgi:hypothetical protein
MATRALAGVALVGASLLATAGCSGKDAPQAIDVKIAEISLTVHVPGELADLTYAIGKAEEGQPAIYFSSRQLETAGGAACTAGATSSVSPYPLGQVVVADETPAHVREEFRDNPEESLGEFLVKVGDEWAYYSAPPDEPCYKDPDVARLQRRLTADLKEALKTLKPVG